MLKGFRDFIMRGNVIDLAVAVVIGAAFTALVAAFTKGLVQPLINLLLGGGVNAGTITINDQVFDFSLVVNAIITFLITAVVVYFVFVAPMTRFKALAAKKRAAEATRDEESAAVTGDEESAAVTGDEESAAATADEASQAAAEQVALLREIRDALQRGASQSAEPITRGAAGDPAGTPRPSGGDGTPPRG